MKLAGPLLASAALHAAAVAGVVGAISLLSSVGTGGVVTVSLVERGMDARGPAGENPEEARFVPALPHGEGVRVRERIAVGLEAEKSVLPREPEKPSDAVRIAGTARDTATRSASLTPAPGIAEGGKGEIGESGTGGSDSLAVVLERVGAVKKYPPLARLRGIAGTSWVSFRVGEGGIPERIEIASSSGSDLLDRAAVRAVQDASPFPVGPAAFRVGLRFEFSE
ncbi:MAG: energy transducer TonB [Nitrospirae bacterium]|nr:energy transducer TonB [Nitrospirota bacterium]